MGTLGARARGSALGLVLDAVLGEPRALHPVAGFGRFMNALERGLYRDDRLAGSVYTAAGVGVGLVGGAGLHLGIASSLTFRRRTSSSTGLAASVSTALAAYLASAQRELSSTALEVAMALAEPDLDRARLLLPTLVGRDPAPLDTTEMARAAVESVAENTVDAVVAPALWAVVGGAPGVLGYRAVNTLDAMVGHRDRRYERFGWASARADDAANFVPARVTALLVAAVRPRRAGAVWRGVRTQAPMHPSPNAGVAEAAFAAALDLRLGGTNRYGDRVETRPPLGWGRPVGPADIARAVRLSRQVTAALAAVLVTAGGLV